MKADAKSRLAPNSKGQSQSHPQSKAAPLTPYGGLAYPNHDALGRPMGPRALGPGPEGMTVGEDLWRRAARGIQSRGCVDDPALMRLRVETAEEGRKLLEETYREYAYRDTWEGLAGPPGERKAAKRQSAAVAVSDNEYYLHGRPGSLGLEEDERLGRDGARIPVNKRGSTGSREFKPTRPATFGSRAGR